MKQLKLSLFAMLILAIAACKEDPTADLGEGIYAVFDTTDGNFVAELNYKEAPMTAANFISLAEGDNPMADEEYKGKPYFDGIKFHRVVKGFVIQGGDPEGNGQGGPGYEFPNETDTGLNHNEKGVLSMANAGPDTNGSQFFITLAPTPQLNGGYSVFGHVVKGQEVVDSIGQAEVINEQPKEDIVMNAVKIIRKGQEAEDFDAPQVFLKKIKEDKKKKEEAQKELEREIEGLAEGYKETDSGLRYKITTPTNGKRVSRGNTIKVFYKGMLSDGKVFDQKVEEDQDPITFKVGTGMVIPGWDEGLLLMKEGEEARFIIPPHLGYGARAVGPIPANSILIFDVKLEEIVD